MEQYAHVYSAFATAYSRSLFVEVLLFEVFGPTHCRLPLAEDGGYPTLIDRVTRELPIEQPPGTAGQVLTCGGRRLFGLHPIGFPFAIYSRDHAVLRTFGLKQCRFSRAGFEVSAQPGDTVVDMSEDDGEAALYFSCMVGPAGKVVCVRTASNCSQVLQHNLSQLAGGGFVQVVCLREPESSKDDATAPLSRTPSSRHDGEAPAFDEYRTVDDAVRSLGLDRVDLLRIDVAEGEADIVRGARSTIIDHAPNLALALYDSSCALLELPECVWSLNPDYRILLDHFGTSHEGGVLFATTDAVATPTSG